MARVKRAVNAQKKRRTILERASGYRGQRSRLYRKAKEQVLHSLNYAYRDRRDRKGDFRQLWITRINAAARANGMTYNRFIQGLKAAGVEVDRKVLADLAVTDAAAFAALVEVAKAPCRPDGERSAPTESGSLTPRYATDAVDRPAPNAPPRVVAARKLLRRAGRDRGRAVPRRGRAGRPRGARGRRGCASCSSPPTRRAAPPRAARRAARRGRPRSPSEAAARAVRTVTPQGIVAVCDLLDVPLDAALARRPALRRGAVDDRRPGQRRHGHADRRRGRRGRGGVRRRQRRPVQRQGRAGLRRQPVPPADRRASATPARRSTRCRARRADARSPPTATASSTSTTRRAAVLAGPTAWLFGSEAHGLPATSRSRPTTASGCRSTAAPRA